MKKQHKKGGLVVIEVPVEFTLERYD